MTDRDFPKFEDGEDLSFDNNLSEKEFAKLAVIENAIEQGAKLSNIKELALSEHGLVDDKVRRVLWPLLAGVSLAENDSAPNLSDFETHSEFHQVVLDVNRSLKRFPPGIPYEQRIALQDQLTLLILRVICKYPNLRYYQGYHDVAVTFLLVLGSNMAYAVMEALSLTHFHECMQETMDATQKRLLFIWAILKFEDDKLYEYMIRSGVGTLFALPWYLTWFGHSLTTYKTVVRLYDFFLASPIYMSLFVTSSIILYRRQEILAEDCDMASIHCILSKIPEDLPIDDLLQKSTLLYNKYSLMSLENEVDELLRKEKEATMLWEKTATEQRQKLKKLNNGRGSVIKKWVPQNSKSKIFTTLFSIFIGLFAYYYKSQYGEIS